MQYMDGYDTKPYGTYGIPYPVMHMVPYNNKEKKKP